MITVFIFCKCEVINISGICRRNFLDVYGANQSTIEGVSTIYTNTLCEQCL